MQHVVFLSIFFFFNDTATTEIYTLSLHDALPISLAWYEAAETCKRRTAPTGPHIALPIQGSIDEHVQVKLHKNIDRKSTRLNSSHTVISYAVFCLKKKTT